jgi:hypothetical protein
MNANAPDRDSPRPAHPLGRSQKGTTRMRLPIGRAIAAATAIAARSLGPVQALLVVRPPSPTKASRPGAAPARGISLVTIEINLNR